jgi:hypothetical protein
MVAMETSLVLFGRMLNGGVEMIFGPAITILGVATTSRLRTAQSFN